MNCSNELDNCIKNKVVGDAATENSSRRLWCLSVSFIGLVIFDSKVSSEMKVNNMVKEIIS